MSSSAKLLTCAYLGKRCKKQQVKHETRDGRTYLFTLPAPTVGYLLLTHQSHSGYIGCFQNACQQQRFVQDILETCHIACFNASAYALFGIFGAQAECAVIIIINHQTPVCIEQNSGCTRCHLQPCTSGEKVKSKNKFV